MESELNILACHVRCKTIVSGLVAAGWPALLALQASITPDMISTSSSEVIRDDTHCVCFLSFAVLVRFSAQLHRTNRARNPGSQQVFDCLTGHNAAGCSPRGRHGRQRPPDH